MPTKKEEVQVEEQSVSIAPVPASQGSNTYAVLALVFGLVSLTGFGLLLGIPAIVLASISLKRGLPEKGLSIAGLITGIISTVLSLLFLAFMIFLFIWGASHPQDFRNQNPQDRRPDVEQRFESSRT